MTRPLTRNPDGTFTRPTLAGSFGLALEERMNNGADDVTVAYPLFRGEGGGSIPTSALHLHFSKVGQGRAASLNREWHSRFPELGGGGSRVCYAAEFDNRWYAAAVWTNPSSPKLPQLAWMMLKRFAVSDVAPKFTASRMMGWMIRDLRDRFADVVMLVSYHDPDVHAGSIYRATGWEHGGETTRNESTTWENRERIHAANKPCRRVVRWFYQLRPTSPAEPEPVKCGHCGKVLAVVKAGKGATL